MPSRRRLHTPARSGPILFGERKTQLRTCLGEDSYHMYLSLNFVLMHYFCCRLFLEYARLMSLDRDAMTMKVSSSHHQQ